MPNDPVKKVAIGQETPAPYGMTNQGTATACTSIAALTRAEVADRLGLSQGSVSHYTRKKPSSSDPLIIEFSALPGVTADEDLGLQAAQTPSRVRNRRRLRQLQELGMLPKCDQQIAARMLDGFLQGRLAS